MSPASPPVAPATRQAPQSFTARLLRQEIVLSYGCTEPAALALAAAAASAAAGGMPRQVEVRADLGTYKNALAVGLPGTAERGPQIAVAAGALIARPERRLNVLAEADEAIWRRAAELVRAQAVTVRPDPAVRGVLVEATVTTARGGGTAKIEGRHDRIVARSKDGEALPGAPSPAATDPTASGAGEAIEIPDAEIRQRLRSPQDILHCLEELDDSDRRFVLAGVETNRALAERALDRRLGLGVGHGFRILPGAEGDLGLAIKSWVAAGVEARMAGEPMPAMTSGGSGNSGLTVILGTCAAAQILGPVSSERLAEALALAHLVNVAIKTRIGRVGPLCGGAIASSTAVACSVAWLLGGNVKTVDRVIRHMVDTVAGTVCDGAGPACALKIAGGLGAALDAALLAVSSAGSVGDDGLAGSDAAGALEALHRLACTGYEGTDTAVTAILTAPQRSTDSPQSPGDRRSVPRTTEDRVGAEE